MKRRADGGKRGTSPSPITLPECARTVREFLKWADSIPARFKYDKSDEWGLGIEAKLILSGSCNQPS